ncbi:amidohydrolase family protein [Pseudotenacibaculum haliotis]|uniref:Amidohydrolase family protein n=1 Tax=Pseudotenacibaculum haliotis TaxID=1862138 RepID=A0ABW5LSG9_9FLAO
MKKYIIYSLIAFFFAGTIIAQQTPAPKQTQAYSIEGATAHLGNGQVIENSLIMFNNGKITFVGSANNKIARQGTVVNAKGKHIYPGFIAVNASLGLAEVDAVRATRDFDETGSMLPHIRSLIAYNAESRVIESMRPNGVLIAEVTPRGGTISGTASVMQLDAWNWEDAAIKADHGIHINWPGSFTSGRWWLGEDPGLKPDKNYPKNVQSIKNYFANAKRYLAGSKDQKDLAFEATKGLFDGSQKLYVHVNGQREITDVVATTKALGINNVVLVSGDGAEKVADLLVKNNIPVVVDRAHRIPDNEDDDYDLPFRNAKILLDAGITVAIGMQGQMERMNTRNLPFYAGTYAAYGVDKEKAVQMITGNAAKILGVEDITGTLEVGKDATLFISKGDALDMRTNVILDAFIQGRKISLESHHTTLWKRYNKKINGK